MSTTKKLFKKARIWILLFFLLVSFIAINPQFSKEGVAIKGVEPDSVANLAGIEPPSKETSPTNYERILEINGEKVSNLEDYSEITSQIMLEETLTIKTDKQIYSLTKSTEEIGLIVQEVPDNNIRKGLDLQGGTRVLLKPETEITDNQRNELIQVMGYRLNTYGLSDVEIRKSDDLLGNKYILVEIAGATKQEVSDLIASQGNFEAKIGNETVFRGGKEDITFVCRNDGTCSGVSQCSTDPSGQEFCRFEFVIHLSPNSAKKHADVTSQLEIISSESGQQILEKPIDFYLDGVLVDSLNIDSDLKGVEAGQIQISGPGYGETRQEAIQDAQQQMNKLQTILLTGSFPFKLEIVKLDTISPTLGSSFVNNSIKVGILAILAVSVVVFIRYRKLKIAIPMIIASLAEVTIILGFAALAKYNLDMAAIAGIIAAVGTGVDDQIVIIDEVLSKSYTFAASWKQRLKKAFFIIMAAYFTTFAAMLPLFRAGAGLIRGFALITIIGISIGVFITRPAFAAMIENLIKRDDE
jgi:preprotein translocase subunit SecD